MVAVTKTDKATTRWADIVAENRRSIAKHVGRDIPVVPVSSVRALAAQDVGLPDALRDRAVTFSGIPALWSAIEKSLTAAEQSPATDALRICLEGLREVERTIEDELAVVGPAR